jgi:thiol-disulfide isomerase/thioredoxin
MIKNLTKRFNQLIKPGGNITTKTLTSVAIFISIIIATVYVVNVIIEQLKIITNKYFLENFEGPKELVMFHMTGCGHCKNFMPHWNAASGSNNTSITMRALERKDQGAQELITKHGISGFPTVLLLGGGEKLKTYGGPRTKEGVLSFCKNNE